MYGYIPRTTNALQITTGMRDNQEMGGQNRFPMGMKTSKNVYLGP